MPPDVALPLDHAVGDKTADGRVLFLAQLPPPHHGQSAVSATVRDILARDGGLEVVHRWRGGARDLADVGTRSLSKYVGFARLLAEIACDWITGRRYRLAYLGMAPWAPTAIRDALLAGAAKLVARRVLVHVHGDGISRIIAGRGARDRLTRSLLRGCELIAITADTGAVAEKSGLFARVHHLPNAVTDPGEPVISQADRITITCLGNLDPRKGVLDFIEIVAGLAKRGLPVRGVVVGAETAALSLDALRGRIAETGAEDVITATGRVTEQEKAAILSGSDVFLYLSRHDLAPLALLEAMSHGLAPIVFDIGGLKEMAGPRLGGNVLAPALRGDSLASAVEALVATYVGDRDRLVGDRRAARARYLEAYAPECFAGRLRAITGSGVSQGRAET